MRTWQPVLLTLVVLGLADALVFGDPPKSGEATVQAPKAERADENPKVIAQPSDQPEEPKEITNSLGMRFVRIPKGTFLMGSPSDDERAEEDELQHQVTLSQDFYMSTLEVTQEQYVRVMGKLPEGMSNLPDKFKGAKLPVVSVAWSEARNFARRLSDNAEESKYKRKYRLPTEAQWEYACRAGAETAFSFGDSDLHIGEFAWYVGNSADKIHEGGQKKPNAFGLYDMHGNVWEWCSDWYGDYPSTPLTDPQGPNSGAFRVLRGGSCFGVPLLVRCAYRGNDTPEFRSDDLGFRLVLE